MDEFKKCHEDSQNFRKKFKNKFGGDILTSVWEVKISKLKTDDNVSQQKARDDAYKEKFENSPILFNQAKKYIAVRDMNVRKDDIWAVSKFPKNICENIVKFYSEKGENVGDCFAGHNSRMQTCFELERNYTGYDVSKEYMQSNEEIKAKLLGNAKQQLLVPKTNTITLHLQSSEKWVEPDNYFDLIFSSPPYWCLPKNTKIVTEQGIKNIQDIKIGEKIYTHKTRFREVIHTFERKAKEKLIEISLFNNNEKLLITKNHKILGIKSENCPYYIKNKTVCLPDCSYKKVAKKGDWKTLKCKDFYKKYNPEFLITEFFEKGDFLCYPIDRKVKDIKSIKISDYVKNIKTKNGKILCNNNQYNHSLLNNSIKLSNDFMRLCGYYIAEGCSDISAISLSFDKNKNKEYIKDVKKIFLKLFGRETKDIIQDNVYRVVFYSTPLCQLFKILFGNSSLTKKIPQFMMQLPLEKQKELIKGYWRGDGCYFKDGYNFVTISYQLAEQIKQILMRFDILMSYHVEKKGYYDFFELNRKKCYFNNSISLNIINIDAIKKFNKIVDYEHKKSLSKRNDKASSFIYKNYAFYKIRNIKQKSYSGSVYNLEIKEDNSYYLNNACVHNCIEFYGDEPEQLGYNHTYQEFLDGMLRVFKESYRVLKYNKFFIINVNDFRKDGKFYCYHKDIIELAEKAGFTTFDVIIMKYASAMRACFAQQIEDSKIMPKIHEYILVFKKINKGGEFK